jgi:Tol biopolymer transport system component
VKVLDFGLAKAVEPTSGSFDVTNSPTITTPAMMTGIGVILGTAAYMSPEQAKGRPADKRSDVWAFGCVLYEMLAGVAAFQGEDVPETLAAILRGHPDWSRLPADVPQALITLLRRCLEKDARQRVSHVAVLKFVLENVAAEGPGVVVPSDRASHVRMAWAVAVVGLIAAAGTATYLAGRRVESSQTVRFAIPVEFHSRIDMVISLEVSPDGRQLAFVDLGQNGSPVLWVRRVDSQQPQPLPGTEGALHPFWSPDNRWLAFFANDKLKKIPAAGGVPEVLCDGNPRGGTWNGDGTIVFTTRQNGVLSRVSAAGGVPQDVTELDPQHGERSHRWPQFLPDGRQFLYFISTDRPETTGVYVGALDSKTKKLVIATGAAARYADPGFLVFLRGRALLAQPFDAKTLELRGEPLPAADRVAVNLGINLAAYSVSATALAYSGETGTPITQLSWFDRSGTRVRVIGGAGEFEQPAASPDGALLAVIGNPAPSATKDVWVIDLARGTRVRVTSTENVGELDPTWSADGKRLTYSSDRTTTNDFYEKPVESGAETVLLKFPGPANLPNSWTPDGRALLFSSLSLDRRQGDGNDLWLLPATGERKPVAFLRTGGYQGQATVSSDGKWVAYLSEQSVYVRPFALDSTVKPESVGNGTDPQWRARRPRAFLPRCRRQRHVRRFHAWTAGRRRGAEASLQGQHWTDGISVPSPIRCHSRRCPSPKLLRRCSVAIVTVSRAGRLRIAILLGAPGWPVCVHSLAPIRRLTGTSRGLRALRQAARRS